VWPNVASDDWCGEHAPRAIVWFCYLHPTVEVSGGDIYCGHPLCGECWDALNEYPGAFREKFLKGPNPEIHDAPR